MSIIHLIAPSGYCVNQQAARRGVERLQAEGFTVGNQQAIVRRYQRFAGNDQERLAELNQLAILPDDTDLVLAVRGGYGASRLLAGIDYAALAKRHRQSPLRLCGHSDFTAIQLALLAQCQMGSLSGPMLAANFGAQVLDSFTWRHFMHVWRGDPVTLRWQSSAPPCQAQGILWGGNLSMLCSLLGTPWLPQIRGGILLLEDVHEPLYRTERMLLQLYYAGVLGQQSAIVLGDFTVDAAQADVNKTDANKPDTDNVSLSDASSDKVNQGNVNPGKPNAEYSMTTVLELLRQLSGVPLVAGLAYGHQPRTVTLPLGAVAQLQHDGVFASLSIAGYG